MGWRRVGGAASLHPVSGSIDPYNILITGASGLVGRALVERLREGGSQVFPLSRRSDAGALEPWQWRPESGEIRLGNEPIHAVVHLAGENIAGRLWSARQKQRLTVSRVKATETLCAALVATGREAPRVMVSASGVGYYGDRGDERLREDSEPGDGFLAELAERWEAASAVLDTHGVRRVQARFGMILAPHGGALAKMALPFRWGLGGRLGSGKQYWSWVAIEDVLSFLTTAIEDPRYQGAFNVVAPHLVTNREFTRDLAQAMRRPVGLPVPSFMVRALFGGMGKEVFLASSRAEPAKLTQMGFTFRYPELGPTLRGFFTLTDRRAIARAPSQ